MRFAQQKEVQTLKDGTKLEAIVSIDLANVKIFDKPQSEPQSIWNQTNPEKLIQIYGGVNQLSVDVRPNQDVAFLRWRSEHFDVGYGDYARFGLIGAYLGRFPRHAMDGCGPEEYSRVVFLQKGNILTAYELSDEKGNAKYADSTKSLEIPQELGGRLPTYQTLISALDQNKSAKRKLLEYGGVWGVWGYVDGKGIDLDGDFALPQKPRASRFRELFSKIRS